MSRESRYKRLTTDKEAVNVRDMLTILGNRDDDPWPIFSDKSSARVSTINLGEWPRDIESSVISLSLLKKNTHIFCR